MTMRFTRVLRLAPLYLMLTMCTSSLIHSQNEEPLFWKNYRSLGANCNGAEVFNLGGYSTTISGYWHEFTPWFSNGLCKEKVSGVVFLKNEKIMFQLGQQRIVYFDFGMDVGSEKKVTIYKDLAGHDCKDISYDLVLEKKKEYQGEMIYKFRFKDISIINRLDLVFLVGKEMGVLGIYLGDTPSEIPHEELIISAVGDTSLAYMNRSNILLDYKWNAWNPMESCWAWDKSFK